MRQGRDSAAGDLEVLSVFSRQRFHIKETSLGTEVDDPHMAKKAFVLITDSVYKMSRS